MLLILGDCPGPNLRHWEPSPVLFFLSSLQSLSSNLSQSLSNSRISKKSPQGTNQPFVPNSTITITIKISKSKTNQSINSTNPIQSNQKPHQPKSQPTNQSIPFNQSKQSNPAKNPTKTNHLYLSTRSFIIHPTHQQPPVSTFYYYFQTTWSSHVPLSRDNIITSSPRNN